MLPPIKGLFTHHAIAVPVIHVDVCGMSGVDGGNAMAARLRAGDAAVAVVVIEKEGTGTSAAAVVHLVAALDSVGNAGSVRRQGLPYLAIPTIAGEPVALFKGLTFSLSSATRSGLGSLTPWAIRYSLWPSSAASTRT